VWDKLTPKRRALLVGLFRYSGLVSRGDAVCFLVELFSGQFQVRIHFLREVEAGAEQTGIEVHV